MLKLFIYSNVLTLTTTREPDAGYTGDGAGTRAMKVCCEARASKWRRRRRLLLDHSHLMPESIRWRGLGDGSEVDQRRDSPPALLLWLLAVRG